MVRSPLSWLEGAAAVWILLAGSASANQSLRPAPERTTLPEGGTTLPVSWWCDYALVDVRLDGAGPFTFLLDTGAGACVVSSEVAERFPAALRAARVRAHGPEGGRVEVGGLYAIDSLAAGDLVLERFDAVVLDLAPLRPALRAHVDGILGFPAFRDVLLSVDYPGREVRVARGRLPEPGTDGVVALLGGDTPRLFATVGSARLALVLDTGSGDGLALPEWPPETDFRAGPVPGLSSVTIAGARSPASLARLEGELRLGAVVVRGPIARRVPGEPRVGVRLLSRLVLTLDGASGRARLVGPGSEPLEVPPRRSLGAAVLAAGEALVVREVLPASPAEAAGLREGDRILTLEGLRGPALQDCDALEGLVERGGVLHARVERDREERDVAWAVAVVVP